MAGYPNVAAVVGSPGLEVLSSAINLWRRSVPLSHGVLEPLLESDDMATDEPGAGEAPEVADPEDSQGPRAV